MVGPLRILLALAFAALLVAQVAVLPPLWAEMARESPDSQFWRWGTLVGTILGLACVQVVIVCSWQLLTLVRDDRIFSARSLPWVNAIVGALALGWTMLLGAFVCSYYFVIDEVSDDPALPALLLVLLLVGAVVGLLVVVMRALLKQATVLRDDLEAVI